VASSHAQYVLQDELNLDSFHDDVSVKKTSAWKADTSTDGTFYSHGFR
jgi:hypothetical protein